jgi:hypothetical protein
MPAIMPTPPSPARSSLVALALLAGCGDAPMTTADGGSSEGSDTTTAEVPTTGAGDGTTGTSDEPSAGATTDASTGGEPLPPADIPEGCNPIAYANDCLLPYPSDFFLVPDADAPGGLAVTLTDAAVPKSMLGAPVDFLLHHPADGFSHHMPILALFPGGIDTEDLTFHLDDGDATLDPASPTILLDAETGALVPHWVELDAMTDDPARQALIVRPYVRLVNSRRYVVAFQGLVDRGGARVEPPLGFAHILAGDVAGHPVLEPLAARYEADIFAPLAAAGVDPDGLQLAWDFTTSSDARNTGDMRAIRDDLMAWFDASEPTVMIDEVIPDFSDEMALRVEGRVEVPLYLEADEPMALLHRGPDGAVVPNGTTWFEFTLQVPKSAWPAGPGFEPVRLIQFGHGFFGEREEINWSAMRAFSTERAVAMISTEWAGMALEDQGAVVETMLEDPARVFTFTDRLHQGFANQLTLSHAIRTSLSASEAVTAFDSLVYDPDHAYWYGISQGSIFGASIMALSPTLERAVLDVGGGPYSLMMTRSGSFSDLFEILKVAIGDDPLTIQKIIALSQHTWDRVDPVTYAPYVLQEPLAGSPERKILFSYGIGDHSVTNVASHLLMRSIGLDLISPAAQDVYGVGAVEAPTDGSAAVVVDFMYPDPAGVDAELPDPPPDEQNVHEGVRRNPKIRDMIDTFLRVDGQIENFCSGPCDPE